MEFELRDILGVLGILVSIFGVWYKLNQDMSGKLDEAKKTASEQNNKLRSDFDTMRANMISRQEHDNDIQNVKAEIRVFRDEVRDDIKTLNTNLTSRFDMMLQRMLDIKGQNGSQK